MSNTKNESSETITCNFRCAFLAYLINDSSKNKNQLYQTSFELAQLAFRVLNLPQEDPDKNQVKLLELMRTALVNIKISDVEIQRMDKFLDEVIKKDKKNENMSAGNTLSGTHYLMKEQVVPEEQYKVLTSLYTIELDGHRIKKRDPIASAACLTLSTKLLTIFHETANKTHLSQEDKDRYIQAYDASRNQGIEKHRGLKEKIYNSIIALSCLFVIPIFYHAYKTYKTGSFWTDAKTKTQEHIDESMKSLDLPPST